MNFEIHQKYRFDFDYSENEYNAALKKYLKHLSEINFDKSHILLKYFGLSFFHDSIIRTINFDIFKSEITITVCRSDDKSDFDYFRKIQGLVEIDWFDYEREPILYKCRFSGISQLNINICSDSDISILDSEINFDKKNEKYLLTLSLSESEKIEFLCDIAMVEVLNKYLIKKYTGNLQSEIPYCSDCVKKLLTTESLKKMIDEL